MFGAAPGVALGPGESGRIPIVLKAVRPLGAVGGGGIEWVNSAVELVVSEIVCKIEFAIGILEDILLTGNSEASRRGVADLLEVGPQLRLGLKPRASGVQPCLAKEPCSSL